jgi:short-subunit dehydrogenase
VASQIPLPLMAAYTAAKHGLRGLVNALRVELQASGSEVRIGLVHPGPVDTPFWNNVTPATVMPPDFPTAYTAERIADELINALEHPRPESIAGGWMQIARAARGVVRPVFDFALAQATRYALANPSDRDPGNALWEASGTARLDGGIEDRPRWVGHAS